jgi:hypothetical protein
MWDFKVAVSTPQNGATMKLFVIGLIIASGLWVLNQPAPTHFNVSTGKEPIPSDPDRHYFDETGKEYDAYGNRVISGKVIPNYPKFKGK